jgi:hypothetical protein
MARRKLGRRGSLEPWHRAALLGLPGDDLDEMQSFALLIDTSMEVLMPVWAAHRQQLLLEWGDRPHPMDGDVPRLPERPRR